MTARYWRFVVLLMLMASGAVVVAGDEETRKREIDLGVFFATVEPGDATFVVLNGKTGEMIQFNPDRAAERFLPASTFKIPNTLIALETGVASGPDHLIEFDPSLRGDGFWIDVWSQDHTLRSAIRNSVVWYYQALAREIGEERMLRYLKQFEYGNCSIEGGVDRFWLGSGGLRISPDEQVRFLQRMYEGRLGVSDRSTEILKEILVLEENPQYRLSGKTGTADVTSTRELAWLVGYVERDGNIWYYALNVEGEQVWETWGPPVERLNLLRRLLRQLEIIPAALEPPPA